MINPEISLGVKPIQIEDPLQSYGKAQNLMATRQAIQSNEEHLKQQRMANEEAALKQQDDQRNSQAWQAAGGDPAKHIDLFGKSGARPQAVQALQKHYKDLEKETAEIDDKKLTVRKDQNERFSALTQQALAMPDDQYAAAWPQIKAAALAIHPEMQSQLPDQPIPKDALQHLGLGLITEKSFLDREEEKRKVKAAGEATLAAADLHAQRGREATEAQRATNAAALAQAAKQGPQALAAALSQLPVDQRAPFAGITAQTKAEDILRIGMKPHEIAAADTAEKNAENNVSEYELRLRAAKGDPAAKKALADSTSEKIRVAQVEAQNKWNLQMGSMTTADGAPSELAKSVADYSVPLSQALSRIPAGVREVVMQQIRKANPDFRAENYDAFRKTEMDATTGKLAQTSNAQSTAIAHMDVLNQAIAALNNGDIKILNQLGNSLGVQVGKTAKTTFEAIVHKVGPELSSAYLASGGSVGERGATEKDFDPSLSPDQLKSNIAVSAKLLAGKVKANQEQYSRGTYGRGKQELLTKDAAAALEKLSGGQAAGGITVTDPNGGTHTFADQAAADKFKKLAGIK